MVKALIYVLCPDEESLECARKEYTRPWETPIIIPQTPWLESIMYVSELMRRRDEWKDMDFVGCIAHTAHTKQSKIHMIDKLMEQAKNDGSDIVTFLTGGYRDIVSNGAQYHPGFRAAWNDTWRYLGYDPKRMSEPCLAFFCNYWCATPEYMSFYCSMMAYCKYRLERTPAWKSLLWRNANYIQGTIPRDKLQQLFGVPYYPLLPFVIERMICAFTNMYARKVTFM